MIKTSKNRVKDTFLSFNNRQYS